MPTSDDAPGVPELIPARMLNEHAYCPRLAYLEWVQRDFEDSADTVEGRHGHRRVDRAAGSLDAPRIHARSVELSAPAAGLIARMDLVEGEGRRLTPVDYKHGAPPDVPGHAWEPERVQLCAQAMILEENGFECAAGVLYFVDAKQRVDVPIDAALRARTLELIADLRRSAAASSAPPPLIDSPKCPRCSLASICLPDEVNLLRCAEDEVEVEGPRRLLPARDDALPLYVQAHGARVGKRAEELVITALDGEETRVRLGQTSHVALLGSAQVTTPALQELCSRGIPVSYFSHGGWFYGMTTGIPHRNVELRQRQFAAAGDPERALAVARRLIAAKIRNSRTLLRRNAGEGTDGALDRLKALSVEVDAAPAAASLLGLEGTAARIYFSLFSQMLRPPANDMTFDFDGRNRRPPRDPVNALLSLAYALLVKDLTITLLAVGFDPYLGFYHRPRYGRPALALDLMEEFRPIVADSVVLSAINTGALRAGDFLHRGAAVALTPAGRGRFIDCYERRMDELVTHPVFGYRISYRRVLEVQARLLGRWLAGEIPDYPGFCTR